VSRKKREGGIGFAGRQKIKVLKKKMGVVLWSAHSDATLARQHAFTPMALCRMAGKILFPLWGYIRQQGCAITEDCVCP